MFCFLSTDIMAKTKLSTKKHTKNISTIKHKLIKVKATAYTPSRRECGKNNRRTATMKRPRPGQHVAVSRDLKWMLGKRIKIKGIGVRKVEDLMHRRYKRRIDIMMGSVKNAREFGVQDVRVRIIN